MIAAKKGERARCDWLMKFYDWAVFHTWSLPQGEVRPGDTGLPATSNLRNISIDFGQLNTAMIMYQDYSRTTSLAFLSFRKPAKLECLRCPFGVHSVNSI